MDIRLLPIAVAAVVVVAVLAFLPAQPAEDKTVLPTDEAGEFEPDEFAWVYSEGDDADLGEAPFPGNCPNVSDAERRDRCWLYEAAEESDAEKCSSIASEQTRADCIMGIAADTLDTGICDMLENTAVKYICIAGVAEEAIDYSICEEIPEEFNHDRCIERVKDEDPAVVDWHIDANASPFSEDDFYED